jgi:cytochrome P450
VSTARPPGPATGAVDLVRLARSRDLTTVIDRAHARAPRLAHVRIGGGHLYLLGTPDLVRELFGPLGRVGVKGRGMQQARRLLGDGLLTSEGELHRTQRRLIQPAFHATRVAAYQQVMADEAAALTRGWTDGARTDLAQDLSALTLRIVGRTLFGADLAAETDRVYGALGELLHRFPRVMVPGGTLLNRLPLPSTRRLEAAMAELDDVVLGLVARADGGVLGMLKDTGMPDRQVRDEVLTLMLAGHETTAAALTWTFLLLDRHPPTRPVEGGYARAVVAEAMRLRPPSWLIGRQLTTDVELDGWTVPAGSLVAASQWVLHRDGRWWDAPLEFRPERWLDPAGRFDEHAPGQPRGAYFPFGMGRRVCVGEQFAWAEATTVLTTLARDWRFAVDPGHPTTPRTAVTLRPRHGLPVTLVRAGVSR